ncbi:hypothetical protein G4E03_003465 [Salmonella enterica]|nr:hypothetical protein [Salmonella enterica]
MLEFIIFVVSFLFGELVMLCKCKRKLLKSYLADKDSTIAELDRIVADYKYKTSKIDELFGKKETPL